MSTIIKLAILSVSYLLTEFVTAQGTNCGLKCQDCQIDNVCKTCEPNFSFSDQQQNCVSKCNSGLYYSENQQSCSPLCQSSYYNDNQYNLCRQFDNCAIVEEYGQQYFDTITASVLTSNSYIVAGIQDSSLNTDFSLKIFSRDKLKFQGIMVAHTSKVIDLQLVTDSGSVSYNSDLQYLISFSSIELVLWDLSRGYAVKTLTFDKLVATQESATTVYYIDEKILILFKSEIEFGVFFFDRLKSYNDKDVITIRLVTIAHTKNIQGFIRTGNLLYSYSMDSNIFVYDLTVIYNSGTAPAALVCSFSNSKYIQNANAFATGEIVFQLYQDKTYVFYDTHSCQTVDVGHSYNVIQIITDEDAVTSKKFIFSLSTYKVIMSKVIVTISNTPTPNTQVLTVTKIQERIIAKSFAQISQNMLLLIDYNGFVLIITYSQERLEEDYSATLMWQTNFALSSATIDPLYDNVVLFGRGIVLLQYDPKRATLQQVDITKNIPIQQSKPTDKVNGFIIDTLYNRLITYSDDGSLRAYERIDIYKNNYRLVINTYHPICNILDNNSCQNKVKDVQRINQNQYAALYSDSSIILWSYTFTSFELYKQLGLEDTSIIQTMNFNPNTQLLIYQSDLQLRVYNTTSNAYVKTLIANSTLGTFNYAFTEIYKTPNASIYVLDVKNRRINVYSLIAPFPWQAFSASYSSKKIYTSARYFSSHRNLVIVSDTNIVLFSPTFTKITINQSNISGFVSDGTMLTSALVSSSKILLFMRNLQVFSYSASVLKAQYTSATNVQDYQTAYGKVNSYDVFAFFQNSGVSTIQNQVVIISGVTLNFQHILTFQDKISTLTIDSANSKLYIGFENGSIYSGFFYQDYEIWQSPSTMIPIGMQYSSQYRLFFYYKSEIRVLSSVNFVQLASLNNKHTTDLVGFFFSDLRKSILSCSSETGVNMAKWDLNITTTPIFTQFQTPDTMTLGQCFLDDVNNISIGYYISNKNLVIWNFGNGQIIYRTDIHKQRSDLFDASQADVDPTMKIAYAITQFSIDTSIQRLISSNNMEEIHMHSYASTAQSNTYITVPKIIKFYIDTYKQRLLVLIQQDYKQTFYSYSYSGTTIEFLKEFQYHNQPVKGIIFQGERAFSYEETLIKVMNRSTYEILTTITCVNPIITNFLIFEKLSQVIIWSDFDQGSFNQSIGIYNLLDGRKIADVLGYQSIETGNIHKIIIDEDSYQLIISKNNPNNYFYTVDLRTFYYTGYYANKNYTTSIRSMFQIKESNQLVYLDQSQIRVMLMELSINTQNNFLPIIDVKNVDQFYNSDEQQLYYIDALEESWQLNTLTKQLLYKIPFEGVRLTNYYNGYFYVVQQQQINKFNRNFVSLGSIDQISVNVTFSVNYMFVVNYLNALYIVDLNSFKSYFFTQFSSTVQDMYINENYQEIFVLQTTKILSRFNFLTKEMLVSYTDLTLDFIRLDTVNNVIFHALNTGVLNIYYNYLPSIPDYIVGQPKQTISALPSSIFRIRLDNQYKTLYILFSKLIPIMQVYSYNYKTTTSALDPPALITIFNLPSRSPVTSTTLKGTYLQITLPWQIVQIDRSSLSYVRINRDNQIFYSQQNFTTLANYNDLYVVSSHNDISLYNLKNNTYINLFSFKLTYPNLVNYTITDDTISYRLQMIGISSGIIFSYNFVIPKIGADLKPLYNIQTCFHQMTNIQYGFQVRNLDFKTYVILSSFYYKQVEQQMITLDQSAKRLNYILNQTLIEIQSQNGFFYHQYMKSYNSNIVYGTLNTEQEIVLRNDTFSKLLQPQIMLDQYNFNLIKGQQVTFPSYNSQVSFINIRLTVDSQNVSFIFNGQQTVVLSSINIDGLTFTGNNSLFQFLDCDSVLIDTFNLKNSFFGGGNYSLFYFSNVKNIEIKNLNITNFTLREDSQADNLIYISNSNLFKFSASTLNNIVAISSNKLLLKFYGILQSEIQSITMTNTQYISFLNSENYFSLEDQTVYLYSDTTLIQDMQFVNIKYLTQSLIAFNGNQLQVIHCNFTSIVCQQCLGASLNIVSTQIFLLSNSQFLLNVGSQGGAVALVNCLYKNLQIIQSSFKNCTALAHGGAIFSSSSDLMLNQTTIQYCDSEIGGGIRYIGIEPLFIYYQSEYVRTLNPHYYIENVIKDNTANIYGQNIGSYPKTILVTSQSSLSHEKYRILTTDTDVFNLDLYSLSDFQSGAEISFEFQILDQEFNPIFFDLNQFENNKYPDIISNEITQFNIKSTPGTDDIKIFGQYITDYFQFNQDTQRFAINQMMIIANPSTSNHVFFETPSIKKVLSPNATSREFSDGPFHIRLNISFRQCIRGEVYKLSGSIFYCQECKEGSYSIIQPIKDQYETQLCLRCPDEASYCYRDQMVLFPGYWKRTNDTDQIIHCINKPENCEGDEDQGYCIIGHIGPLCEACDVYGKVWKSEYQNDGKFGCIDCTKLRKASYVLPTLFIALGIILYILISIRIALQISKLIVIGYYLRKLNILAINKSSYQDTTNMNLKAMMNYMQISSMINTFVIKLPEWMTFIPDYLGSPVENMLYTFDCYLNKASQQQYPIIFLRTVWFLAVPVLYLAVVGLFYWILVMLKIAKYDKSYIISGLVFLCFFTQPNMVSNLLGVMSCRNIDNKYYIQSDISFECYTSIHLQYIGIVCFPGLILWAVFIPFFILRKLIKNKNNLDSASIRLKYGFLYQDYKNKHFYWEFVRVYTKLLVIGILSFYGDPYTNKLVIILILFLIYQVALIKFQPYQMKYFQNLDKTSMIVFIILLIMNIFLYNRPDEVQSQIFYIILIIIHNGYQFLLLLEVIKAKLSVKFKIHYNRVMNIIIKFFPFMKRFITINKPIPMKTFQYWMKVKFFLNECSERKVYNEKNNPQFGRSSDIGNPEQRFFQPSKRNRNRLFNQNLQLSSSKNNIMNPDNMIFSEELSYRNGLQMAKLLKENQPLSAERSESNMNQLLSPKMICSFSHLSDKMGMEQRRDDFILEFDDPQTTNSFQKITYGQLLRSLFNYADVEEEEDERRMQKKASVHNEYRLYQKTDLLRKNLKPVEMDESKINFPAISHNEEQNPDINESFHEINEDKNRKGRYAKNLAPRFFISQERLDESTKNENESTSKNEPTSDLQQNVGEVEQSEQSESSIHQMGKEFEQSIRHVYLQPQKSLHAKQQENNLFNDEIIIENDNLVISPEELEEDEDNRRLIKKIGFQHDFNIQRKANLIYKNLVYITYDPSIINEVSENSSNKEGTKDQDTDKFLHCDIDDSLLSLEDNDKISNQTQDKKDKRSFKEVEKEEKISNQEQQQEQDNQIDQEIQLQNDVEQQPKIQQSPQQVSMNQKTFDISASEQVQDIINIRAQNLGQTVETSNNQNVSNLNNNSYQKSISTELQNFKRGSSTIGNPNQDSLANMKRTNPESNKLVHKIVNDIIQEDENANIEEEDEDNTVTGKDNLTETNNKKLQSYFDNANQNPQNEEIQEIEASKDKDAQRVEYITPTPNHNVDDSYSAIPDHNDDNTLYKNEDFTKQFTGMGMFLQNQSPINELQFRNNQAKQSEFDSNSEDYEASSVSRSNPGSQQIINLNLDEQVIKPSVFSKLKDNIQMDGVELMNIEGIKMQGELINIDDIDDN